MNASTLPNASEGMRKQLKAKEQNSVHCWPLITAPNGPRVCERNAERRRSQAREVLAFEPLTQTLLFQGWRAEHSQRLLEAAHN